jgi:hypothetical protein
MNAESLKEAIRKGSPHFLRTDPDLRAYILELTRREYAVREETQDRFYEILAELRRDREEQTRKWEANQEEQNHKWEEENRSGYKSGSPRRAPTMPGNDPAALRPPSRNPPSALSAGGGNIRWIVLAIGIHKHHHLARCRPRPCLHCRPIAQTVGMRNHSHPIFPTHCHCPVG